MKLFNLLNKIINTIKSAKSNNPKNNMGIDSNIKDISAQIRVGRIDFELGKEKNTAIPKINNAAKITGTYI